MRPALIAVAMTWIAGAGLVAACWPRRTALPTMAWLALSGLIGPCAVGAALLAAGSVGLSSGHSVPIITALCAGVFAVGAWRRQRVLPSAARTPVLVSVVLVAAVGWTSAVAIRTHLGWDGTVVWYHKARVLAASDGVMPSATLAEPTRVWAAPDYPLHVPLAMAWVRLWLPEEDERAIKVLPAAWCAAILLLVAAAVLERSGSSVRASCAVLVIAATPRLLIGEGSYTSGYADGPLAGLLAALVWTIWRSDHGASREWYSLLAAIGVALAWTKQEGPVAVLVAGAMCAWRGRSLWRSAFAWPALVVAAAWQGWTSAQGAPSGMAYAWPGTSQAVARVSPILCAYTTMIFDVRTWGLLWPGLGALLVVQWRHLASSPAAIVAVIAASGALAFVWSGWPDVGAHLTVTVPRLGAGLLPALVVLALGVDDGRVATLRQPHE